MKYRLHPIYTVIGIIMAATVLGVFFGFYLPAKNLPLKIHLSMPIFLLIGIGWVEIPLAYIKLEDEYLIHRFLFRTKKIYYRNIDEIIEAERVYFGKINFIRTRDGKDYFVPIGWMFKKREVEKALGEVAERGKVLAQQ